MVRVVHEVVCCRQKLNLKGGRRERSQDSCIAPRPGLLGHVSGAFFGQPEVGFSWVGVSETSSLLDVQDSPYKQSKGNTCNLWAAQDEMRRKDTPERYGEAQPHVPSRAW
jgi:hypothetical protein